MRLIAILISFFGLSLSSWEQSKRYYDWLDRTEKESFVSREATTNELSIIDFDKQGYEGIIMNELNQIRKLRSRGAFKVDSIAHQVCNVGVKHFPKRFFRTNKFNRKIIRHTEFGIRHLNGEHRIFKVFTFNVNLTHLKSFSRFYYASGDESTDLKLFEGSRPKYHPDDERYVDPVPVKPKTERELVNMLLKKVHTHISNKAFTHIGVALRVDEYSIHRHKIPRAFVMIIFCGKQTQKVRRQKLMAPKDGEDEDPYVPIKQRET